MPVVHMDDIGRKAYKRQCLQHRAGEVGVLLALKTAAAVDGLAEVILVIDKVNRDSLPVV